MLKITTILVVTILTACGQHQQELKPVKTSPASNESAAIAASEKTDPLSNAPFSLDDSQSKFKLLDVKSSVYTYSVGGIDNLEDLDNPFLVIAPVAGRTPEGAALKVVEALEKRGADNLKIAEASSPYINGYKSYEAMIFTGKEPSFNCIYLLTMVKDGKALMFQGITNKDFEKNYNSFKSLAHTMRFK